MRKQLVLLLYMFIATIALAGCNKLVQTPNRSIASLTPQLLLPATPSIIANITPTTLITSTVTLTPFPTITSSKTPSPVTPTIRATLTKQESDNLIVEWLGTGAGCELPCFWGITPGQTPIETENQVFHYLGWNMGIYTGTLGTTYWTGNDLADSLSIRVGSTQQEGIVDSLMISIGGSRFLDFVQHFSFKRVLMVHGEPTRIQIYLGTGGEIGTPQNASYHLLLFYDSQGILVDFSGVASKVGTAYRICPSDPYFGEPAEKGRGAVSIYAQSPAKLRNLESLVQLYGGNVAGNLSIEKAAGLSIEEFYKLATQDDLFCFETPRDNWP